jgi:hypothetical protein
MVPAFAASAAPGHAGRLASSRDAPSRGLRRYESPWGEPPSPPDVLPALAPASAEAVAVLAVEPPDAANAEMAKAPLLKAGNRKPAPGALAADLAVAVGSAQSAQAAASEQRAQAEGMSWLF